jgi:hypothetical protein
MNEPRNPCKLSDEDIVKLGEQITREVFGMSTGNRTGLATAAGGHRYFRRVFEGRHTLSNADIIGYGLSGEDIVKYGEQIVREMFGIRTGSLTALVAAIDKTTGGHIRQASNNNVPDDWTIGFVFKLVAAIGVYRDFFGAKELGLPDDRGLPFFFELIKLDHFYSGRISPFSSNLSLEPISRLIVTKEEEERLVDSKLVDGQSFVHLTNDDLLGLGKEFRLSPEARRSVNRLRFFVANIHRGNEKSQEVLAFVNGIALPDTGTIDLVTMKKIMQLVEYYNQWPGLFVFNFLDRISGGAPYHVPTEFITQIVKLFSEKFVSSKQGPVLHLPHFPGISGAALPPPPFLPDPAPHESCDSPAPDGPECVDADNK